MSIIAWIILGGLAGWIASVIMRTDEEQGIIGNVVVGIVGALFGGLVVQLLGGGEVLAFNIYSLVVAIIGATALLAVVRSMRA